MVAPARLTQKDEVEPPPDDDAEDVRLLELETPDAESAEFVAASDVLNGVDLASKSGIGLEPSGSPADEAPGSEVVLGSPTAGEASACAVVACEDPPLGPLAVEPLLETDGNGSS
ncbi:MAG: hypothetical protein ABSC94_01195 [Polyangiaceae bacterium]|jgi:hypothetical protein